MHENENVELDDNVRLADKKLVVSYEQTTATSKQKAGLYIYSGIEPTGFIRTTAAGTGWEIKDPINGYTLTLNTTVATSTFTIAGNLDVYELHVIPEQVEDFRVLITRVKQILNLSKKG